MNVLHVLGYSMPNLSGYTIRSKYIVETEKAIGINPFVLTSPKYQHEVPFVWESVIEGILYYRIRGKNGILRTLPYLREYLLTRDMNKRVLQIVKERKISLIHAHSPSLNGLASLNVAQKFSIPMVYEMRALWEEAAVESGKFGRSSLKYKLSRYVEEKLFARVRAVVTISDHLRENLILRGVPGNKIFVVPNGVDTGKFAPIPTKDKQITKQYELESKIVIGYIGSFFKFEGITYLVRAFSEIWRRNKNVKLVLVGDGEDRPDIVRLIGSLGLQNEVILVGKVPHDEILKYYSIMDILVYPRIRGKLTEEVTPLKPLEAMSMEKAVIGSDVGGLKELIKDRETGLLFRAEDVADLVDKCMELIMDRDRRTNLAKKARQGMVENRDWSKIAMKYLEIYDQSV